MTAARRQVGTFYARERRKSLAAYPKLFRTHAVAPGQSLDEAFPEHVLSEPLTIRTRFLEDGVKDRLFSIGAAHVPGSGTPPDGPDVVLTRQPDRVGLFLGNRVGQYFGVDLQNGQEEGIVVGLRPGDNTLRVWDRTGLIGSSDSVVYPEGRWSSPNSVIAASSALLEPLSLYVNQLPQQYLSAGPDIIPVATEGTVLEIATAPELFSTLGFPLLEGN